MLEGLGTDIIEISRIRLAIKRHPSRFINHLFTKKEQSYCLSYKDSFPHFAARFAAKEAILKALGTGLQKGISWKDLEIINDKHGKPEVYLSKRLQAIFGPVRILLSMSHCKEYATATAILL